MSKVIFRDCLLGHFCMKEFDGETVKAYPILSAIAGYDRE